jgi:hypothetical protein
VSIIIIKNVFRIRKQKMRYYLYLLVESYYTFNLSESHPVAYAVALFIGDTFDFDEPETVTYTIANQFTYSVSDSVTIAIDLGEPNPITNSSIAHTVTHAFDLREPHAAPYSVACAVVHTVSNTVMHTTNFSEPEPITDPITDAITDTVTNAVLSHGINLSKSHAATHPVSHAFNVTEPHANTCPVTNVHCY